MEAFQAKIVAILEVAIRSVLRGLEGPVRVAKRPSA
jgi:hypothetical protein